VPLVSIGIGAAPAFVYVAVKYKRPKFLVPALAYLVVMISAVALVALGYALSVGIGIALILGSAGIASAHALAVRGDVAIERDFDSQVTAARDRLRRRTEARKLVAGHPELARELGIGRPDLHGGFDDGGLVDVNHSPMEVLAELPGVDAGIARRIVTTRTEIGGFSSVDEMSVTLDLPPAQLDAVSDRLLFLNA